MVWPESFEVSVRVVDTAGLPIQGADTIPYEGFIGPVKYGEGRTDREGFARFRCYAGRRAVISAAGFDLAVVDADRFSTQGVNQVVLERNRRH
jgi:hypothetical protein